MKTKRIFFLSLAVALALILTAGGVLFALSAARRARAVASYRNLTLEKGTYSYFASFYKGLYLASLRADGVGAYDTPVFWELTDSEGVRYGQRLSDGFSDYIRRTLVAASLFDRAATLSAEEKNALIRENPLYGRVICRCETVTEGEIVAAIHSPVPPTTINGVKRRVGAGMGRCQGGFCGPRVQEILSREFGIPMDKILMDQPGTYILTGETKGGAHE